MGSGFDSLSPSMKIFSGNSNRQLAEKICNYLDVDLGKLNISQFSDGELSIAFDENIRNENVFIIQSTNPPAENILELMLILDAAKRASAKTVTIVMPYFGYGRQDRKDRPRVPISSRVILDMAVGLGVDRIVSMDLHSSQIQGFVNVPFDHLYSRMALFNELKKMNLDEETGVVLAPDVGSAKMSQAYAKSLGISFALIDKRRPKATQAVVANLVGDLKNKKVLIIDDMIDTAGTICNAADAAMDNGAISVTAIATHPVLSGPAVDRLMNSKIDKVIVCDTIEITDDKIFNKLEVISVANVFGEAIKRIIDGTSLSSMFREAKG